MKIKPIAWVLLFVLGAIWGTSFILIKQGLRAFDSFQVGALRICLAGLVMLPVYLVHYKMISRKQSAYALLFGLTNAGIPSFLFAWAQTMLHSSTAGILNALTPLFSLVVGALFFGIALTWNKAAGVLVGLAGALFLILYGHGTDRAMELEGGSWLGYALVTLATVLYGFSGHIMKQYLQDTPSYLVSAVSYLGFAIPLSIALAFTNVTDVIFTHPQGMHSFLSLLLLAAVGSALAIVLLSKLVKSSNALFGSFTTYIIPFTAILWGLADKEPVHINALLGLAIILFGIGITTIKPKAKVVQPEPAESN